MGMGYVAAISRLCETMQRLAAPGISLFEGQNARRCVGLGFFDQALFEQRTKIS